MKQRAVFVTGGTRGVGRALVEHYRNQGWTVWTCGRSEDAVAALNRLDRVRASVVDLASADDRMRLAGQVGPLDVVIHNAAIQRSARFEDADPAQIAHEIEVNLVAPLVLTRQLAPRLKPGAVVANVSSGLAYVPLGRSPVYCATKAGLSMYTRSIRRQTPDVHFVEVVLPMVDTDMTAGRGGAKVTAPAAARAIAKGIAERRETIRVGKARGLPWLLRVAPSLLATVLNRSAGRPEAARLSAG